MSATFTQDDRLPQSLESLSTTDGMTRSFRVLQTKDRAVTAPNLSISIPQTKSKHAIGDGAGSQEEDDEDSEAELTAASSICHSPGWDDPISKKQKKEKEEARKKKKKDMEKAAAKALAKAKADAKQAEREKRNRLSKANPATSRLSKMGFTMNRSASTPVVPTISEHHKSLSEDLPKMAEAVEKASLPGPDSHVAWKTAHGTPAENVSRAISPNQQTTRSRSSSQISDGFIGGLKLQLAVEELKQEKEVEQVSSSLPQQYEITSQPVHKSSESSSSIPSVIEEGDGQVTDRTPEQWESIYERAASLLRSDDRRSRSRSRDSKSAGSHGNRLRKKSYPPTSYFPDYLAQNATNRTSASDDHSSNNSENRTSDEAERRHRRSASTSSGRPSSSTRDTSFDAGLSHRGRNYKQTYVERQPRQQSEDGVMDQLRNEQQAQQRRERQRSRGRQLSFSNVKNFIRSPSSDRASTAASPNHRADDTSPRAQPFSASRPASRGNLVGVPSESGLHQRRSSSRSNLPTVSSIRSAAKSVFSRGSTNVSSADPDPADVHMKASSVEQHQHRRHFSSTSSSASTSGNKAERFFGQPLTGHIVGSPVDSQPPSSSNTLSPAISVEAESHKSTSSRGHQQQGITHARSTTNSSEGYSTLDESSAITTPIQSVYGAYNDSELKLHQGDHVYDNEIESDYVQDKSYLMTSALPLNTQKIPGSPYPSLKAPAFEAPAMPKLPSIKQTDPQTVSELSSGSNRQPTITRSISTPELPQQDLSFLPVLKHQPLTRPSKATRPDSVQFDRTTIAEENHPRSTLPVRPKSSILKPTTILQKPPISSQHLQNARMSMPRPVRSGPPLSNHGGGAEPIAKMFVICCSCKYFHDMPSKIYECMARSENVVEDKDLGVSGVVSTSVRCPWCAHGMTTACCAGYAAVVVLREKLH